MKKANTDTSKPKRKYRKYTRKENQAELREAINKAHKRLVGDEPSMGRLQFGGIKK